jgi:putative ABC transport system permease protein
METSFFMNRMPVGVVFGMGTVVAGLIGSVIVGISLYSLVLDRRRDFGTLKAIGATKRDLLRLLIAQAWLLFAAGSIIGLFVFYVVKAHATQAPMLSPPWMIAAVIATAFVSCSLAAVAAIRRVFTIDPAIVFRG